MMEASGIGEFPQNFFRFPSGLSFHSKFRNQSEKLEGSAHFLSSLGGPRRDIDMGHGLPGKPSFSIDSLLGLNQVGRGPRADHPTRLVDWKTGQHQLQGFHSTQASIQHQQEEGRRTKVGLRYSPYKRERKGGQQAEGSESKEAVSRSGKAKRVRTIFTPEQLEKLESEFERQQYMVGTERSYLADSLDLTEAQVKVWFQNRRIKWRKVHLEMQQERLRALRSQETQDDFEESSGSSSSGPSPSPVTRGPFPAPPLPLSSQSESERGPLDGIKSTDWDASLFDVDAYLLTTLGSLRPVPGWRCPPCPSQVTSESETDSD